MVHRDTCVRQTGQSDCSAATLVTVALHYQRPIAIQQLRDLAGTAQIGTHLRGLLHAVEALELCCQECQRTLRDTTPDATPRHRARAD